jgi:hypothetical protein
MKRLPPERRAGVLRQRRRDGELRRFLDAHADDPTVRAMRSADAGSAADARDDAAAAVDGGHALGAAVDALVAAVRACDLGAVRSCCGVGVGVGVGSPLDVGLAQEVVGAFREVAPASSAEVLGALRGCPVFLAAVDAYNLGWPSRFLFDLVNNGHDDAIGLAVELPAAAREALGVSPSAVGHLLDNAAILCSYAPNARILLRHFGAALSRARGAHAALVEAATAAVNVPVLELLLRV